MFSRIFRRASLCLPALLHVAPLAAQDPFFFPAFNQAALARHAPLPAPGAATATATGRLVGDWTSESLIKSSAVEDIRLDGETLRLAWQQRWHRDDFRFAAELPLLMTGGGVLDSAIENWHDWFGLPNGDRDKIPRDEYRYRYVRDGRVVFDVGDSGVALGDARVQAARCGLGGGCVQAMLQLPTGDADRLLGGGLGAAVWYERGYVLDAAGRFSGVVAAGGSAVRRDGPLRDLQESVVPFGWLSLGVELIEQIQLGAQLYAHGALYRDSKLDALSGNALQLAFGLHYLAPDGGRWSLAFHEDLVLESSPDFVIQLAVDLR